MSSLNNKTFSLIVNVEKTFSLIVNTEKVFSFNISNFLKMFFLSDYDSQFLIDLDTLLLSEMDYEIIP